MSEIGRTARILVLLFAIAELLKPNLIAKAENVGITCYGINGQGYDNNTLCPGSNACCGHKATCLSNRLCHNPGDGPEVWVRGPCAKKTFDETCGQICLYNETEASGGLLPRVTPCGDGSLCCSNDPQCCQNNRGVFLNENGNIIKTRATAATTSYPPLGTGIERFTQTPSISTSITTRTRATSETATLPNGSTSQNPGNSIGVGVSGGSGMSSTGDAESTTLKVGLGLSVPLAVLFSATAMYFWLRKRQRSEKSTEPVSEGTVYTAPSTWNGPMSSYYGKSFVALPPPAAISSPTPTVDLSFYSGAGSSCSGRQPQSPIEVGSPGVRELPTDHFYQYRPSELSDR